MMISLYKSVANEVMSNLLTAHSVLCKQNDIDVRNIIRLTKLILSLADDLVDAYIDDTALT